MVLDEDIDQEQDSVTSRLGRITLCFVLCEIILRQVFSPCFTTVVSLVLVVLRRFGCLMSHKNCIIIYNDLQHVFSLH